MAMRTAVESATTRAAVVQAARVRFAADGYASTSIDAVAAEAGLTKGAVYHHFTDKRELFEAAVSDVQDELLVRVEGAATRATGSWNRLRAAVREMLAGATSDDVRVLMLTEGPAVLGLERWRALDGGGHVAAIARFIKKAMDDGDLPPQPVEPLARLLRAVITEAAMAVATSPHPERTRREMEAATWRLIASLKRST